MKKLLATLAVLAGTASALAMGHKQASREALFLTDKMAYELGLDERQREAVYEINYDYFRAVGKRSEIDGKWLMRRNYDINVILTPGQYSRFYKAAYFYKPLYWDGGFRWRVHTRYADRTHFYYGRPRFYSTYRGAHGWKHNKGKSWYKGHKHHGRHGWK